MRSLSSITEMTEEAIPLRTSAHCLARCAALAFTLVAALTLAPRARAQEPDAAWRERMERRLSDVEAQLQAKDAEIARLKAATPTAQSAAPSAATSTASAFTPDSRRRKGAKAEALRAVPTKGTFDEAPLSAEVGWATPEGFDVNKYVSLGDFPGSIHIPGTEISFQIGGFAMLDANWTDQKLSSNDTFVPSTIPTTGRNAPDVEFSVRQTRFLIKTQAPTPFGDFTTFLETEFFNSTGRPELRIRHAYGEIGRILAGQTWSGFMDASIFPNLLDYWGPPGMIFVRQPMIRVKQEVVDALDLAVSAERPGGDVTPPAGVTGQAVDPAPDMVVNLRYHPEWGHVQLAGIGRLVSFDPEEGERTTRVGWGANLSGSYNTVGKDVILYQFVGGRGISRYYNDIGGLGLDMAPKDNGRLTLVYSTGGVLGYQHWWTDAVCSTGSLSYARVIAGEANLPGSTYERGYYATINLVWYPLQRVMVGVEYLHGIRVDQDDSEGHANRVQVSAQFKF